MVTLQGVIILTLADFIKFFDFNEFWEKRKEFLELFKKEQKRVQVDKAEPFYSFVSSSDEYLLLCFLVMWLRKNIGTDQKNIDQDQQPESGFNMLLTIHNGNLYVEPGVYSIITGKTIKNKVSIPLGRLADYLNAKENLKEEHKIGLTILYLLLKANETGSTIDVNYDIPVDLSKVEELDKDKVYSHGEDSPLHGKILTYNGSGNISVSIEGTREALSLEFGECITGLFTEAGGCYKLIKCGSNNKYLQFRLTKNKDGVPSLKLTSEDIKTIRNTKKNNDEDLLKAKNLVAHITRQDDNICFEDVLSYTIEDDKMAIVFFNGEVKTFNWYSLLWNIDIYKKKYEQNMGKILLIKDEHTFVAENNICDIS